MPNSKLSLSGLSGFRAFPGRLVALEAALHLLTSIELRDLDTVAAGTLASTLAKGLLWLSGFHTPELNVEGSLSLTEFGSRSFVAPPCCDQLNVGCHILSGLQLSLLSFSSFALRSFAGACWSQALLLLELVDAKATVVVMGAALPPGLRPCL